MRACSARDCEWYWDFDSQFDMDNDDDDDGGGNWALATYNIAHNLLRALEESVDNCLGLVCLNLVVVVVYVDVFAVVELDSMVAKV